MELFCCCSLTLLFVKSLLLSCVRAKICATLQLAVLGKNLVKTNLMEESFFIRICLALLYSYTNAIRGRYIKGYNIQRINISSVEISSSRSRISTLVAVRVHWIETLRELWTCNRKCCWLFGLERR